MYIPDSLLPPLLDYYIFIWDNTMQEYKARTSMNLDFGENQMNDVDWIICSTQERLRVIKL